MNNLLLIICITYEASFLSLPEMYRAKNTLNWIYLITTPLLLFEILIKLRILLSFKNISNSDSDDNFKSVKICIYAYIRRNYNINSKLAGTTMCKSLRVNVGSERAGLVSTFRTVYSARLQENVAYIPMHLYHSQCHVGKLKLCCRTEPKLRRSCYHQIIQRTIRIIFCASGSSPPTQTP